MFSMLTTAAGKKLSGVWKLDRAVAALAGGRADRSTQVNGTGPSSPATCAPPVRRSTC